MSPLCRYQGYEPHSGWMNVIRHETFRVGTSWLCYPYVPHRFADEAVRNVTFKVEKPKRSIVLGTPSLSVMLTRSSTTPSGGEYKRETSPGVVSGLRAQPLAYGDQLRAHTTVP